jgi:hypothetical protein
MPAYAGLVAGLHAELSSLQIMGVVFVALTASLKIGLLVSKDNEPSGQFIRWRVDFF